MLMPPLQEIHAERLDQINGCAAMLLMSDVLRDAVGTRIGAPQGMNYNMVIVAQLTPTERDNTVDNIELPDGVPPQGQAQVFRPPAIFEKTHVALCSTW